MEYKYQAQNCPFYARANGALKCREVQDGYSLTTHYGHTALTTYFAGLDDVAEYIYFTAANESDTVLSIMRELEKALKEARLKRCKSDLNIFLMGGIRNDFYNEI